MPTHDVPQHYSSRTQTRENGCNLKPLYFISHASDLKHALHLQSQLPSCQRFATHSISSTHGNMSRVADHLVRQRRVFSPLGPPKFQKHTHPTTYAYIEGRGQRLELLKKQPPNWSLGDLRILRLVEKISQPSLALDTVSQGIELIKVFLNSACGISQEVDRRFSLDVFSGLF